MKEENIVATIGTGLANKTEPVHIPEAYKEKTMRDTIDYMERCIERDGTEDDKVIITNVHDQMKKNFVIVANGKNVRPDTLLNEALNDAETKEIVQKDINMKYKELDMTVSSVQKAGKR